MNALFGVTLGREFHFVSLFKFTSQSGFNIVQHSQTQTVLVFFSLVLPHHILIAFSLEIGRVTFRLVKQTECVCRGAKSRLTEYRLNVGIRTVKGTDKTPVQCF